MAIHMMLFSTPVVLTVLVRVLRRPQPRMAALARDLRDLITLRMVLRDSDPCQRGGLLDAHRRWRAESPGRPARLRGRQRQRRAQ